MNSNDKTRWQRVKALFKAAYALPAEERPAWLSEQCAGDSTLYDEVSRLLRSETIDEYLGNIVQGAAKETIAAAAADKLEHRVGNYKLIELIGTGGMGNVYRAERDDQQFDHQVAIKLLHAHLGDAGVVQRFQLERQTLANLDHPNIARLLDGGETDDKAPFLVMEYVDGTPIDKYCDEHRLSVRERLLLFQKVCAAVDYAHRNLIVHRDIKPSNILVNKSGEPKLLDFGIAKFIDSSALNYAVAPTREGGAAMTPEFASPEQVRGEAITTATDVYSLGVLLYILLSGRRPYMQQATNMAAIARAICETEPSRPSTVISLDDDNEGAAPDIVASRRTSIGKLTKLLSGDLDNIVMKALQKEPERRYSSPLALSGDVDNYLSDEPVAARPDSLLYRAGKFIRRNRWGVATAALVLMLVVGFPSYYSVQVTEQRDLAQQEAQKAARVSEFMLSLFRTPDPSQAQGETVTARSLLDQGALRIARELEGQPAVRAAMQDVMGGAFQGLGLYTQSQELLESALQTRIDLLGDEHEDVLQTATRIASLTMSMGNFAKSEALYREALALSYAIYGDDSLSAASLLSGLANAIADQGRQDEARAYYDDALAMHARLSPDPSQEKAITLHGYGWLLTNMAEFSEAESMLRMSVAMLRETAGEFHPEVPAAMNHLTYALMDGGQWSAAEEVMREGLAISTQIYGEEHPGISADLITMGTILEKRGKHAEAEELYRRGLAIDLKLLGENHPYVASDKNNLAGVLKSQGRYEEAVALYEESLELNRRLHGREHPETATSISNLGLTLLQLGEFDAAEQMLVEASRIRVEVLGEEHPASLSSRNLYAIYLYLVEDYEASRAAFEDSLEKRTRVLGESHSSTVNTRLGLSETLRDMALLDEAVATLEPALQIVASTLGEEHPIRARTIYVQATLLDRAGNVDEAETLYRQTLDRYGQILTPDHPRQAVVRLSLGDLLARTGKTAECLPLLEEALSTRTKILPDGHWEVAVARSVLGNCQSALAMPEAGSTLQQSADSLLRSRGPNHSETRLAMARLEAHRAAQR